MSGKARGCLGSRGKIRYNYVWLSSRRLHSIRRRDCRRSRPACDRWRERLSAEKPMNEANDPHNFGLEDDRLMRPKVRLLPRRARPRMPLKQRVHQRKAQLKRGVYIIPSLFTTGNLICGFFSLISTFNGEYFQAALFIIFANILDGLDGLVA